MRGFATRVLLILAARGCLLRRCGFFAVGAVIAEADLARCRQRLGMLPLEEFDQPLAHLTAQIERLPCGIGADQRAQLNRAFLHVGDLERACAAIPVLRVLADALELLADDAR